jgi:hypothetical protein
MCCNVILLPFLLSVQRKRPDGPAGGAAAAASKKPLTPEEEAFIARREAARQRVAKRTMDGFGLT